MATARTSSSCALARLSAPSATLCRVPSAPSAPASRSPARCAEQLLEAHAEAQADLVLALDVRFAGLVLRTLNGLQSSAGWQWTDSQASRYSSARYLLMIWVGLYDHALQLESRSSTEPGVDRVTTARLAAIRPRDC